MLSHFDLDTAMAHCKGPPRLMAFMLTMCVRDGADRLTIGPDPKPRMIGVEVTYSISGTRHELVPPPIAVLPKIIQFLRGISEGEEGECPLRLSGHEFAGCILHRSEKRRRTRDDRFAAVAETSRRLPRRSLASIHGRKRLDRV